MGVIYCLAWLTVEKPTAFGNSKMLAPTYYLFHVLTNLVILVTYLGNTSFLLIT